MVNALARQPGGPLFESCAQHSFSASASTKRNLIREVYLTPAGRVDESIAHSGNDWMDVQPKSGIGYAGEMTSSRSA